MLFQHKTKYKKPWKMKIQNSIIKFLLLFTVFSCEYEKYESVDEKNPLAKCIDGKAGDYECNNYDLISHISLEEMNATAGNDCWGWTDSSNGYEYALMGLDNGIAFINISDPYEPIYLGTLPTNTLESFWRDVKVFQNYAFIVSEAPGHGMQVFNLEKLRGLQSVNEFEADYVFEKFGNAHNIAINEQSGYAYIAGAGDRGIYAININNPTDPAVELEYPDFGYSHDIQIVNYKGPDSRYSGKEIYLGSNENKLIIVDVTDKNNTNIISEFTYDESVQITDQYTHQSWMNERQNYLFLGDEFDELNKGCIESGYTNCELVQKTKTYVLDLNDLEEPKLHFVYNHKLDGIDHNGYINDNKFYLAAYTNGLRVIDILNVEQKTLTEIGYFDTYPSDHENDVVKQNLFRHSDPGEHTGKKGKQIEAFNGAWSVYPFFKSENVIISDINSGLFIVKKSN